MPRVLWLSTMVMLMAAPWCIAEEPSRRLNVLLIVADDLRTDLGCYGSAAKTPEIDRFAGTAVRFHRAYCQQALCNPSRTSFLTGQRPDQTRIWHNGTHFREVQADVMTLPKWFMQNGYESRGVGKIFHNWHTKAKGDRGSWSADEFLHYAMHQHDSPQGKPAAATMSATAPHCTNWDVTDSAYYDGRVADEAIRVLNEPRTKPFFLAVGFWKPHAPFNAPKKYWDLYDRKSLPKFPASRPTGAPEIAFHDGRELRGIPPKQQTFTAEQVEEIRHGYLANISYLDAQIGRVLAELAAKKLDRDTVVVFMSDHGYHLGEHELWAKTSIYERDCRVPLMIRIPGKTAAGKSTESLAELVDLFPTLVDACGLPASKGLAGTSLVSIVTDPKHSLKSAAYSQHPRPAYFDRTPSQTPEAMGYSVRINDARYTEWRDWKSGKVVARELYDHHRDPDELRNIADDPTATKLQTAARKELERYAPAGAIPAKLGLVIGEKP